MGWTFVRMPRDQLIRELIAPQDDPRARLDVIDYTLVDNVLWTLVRIIAKQPGVRGLAAGETSCFIDCDLLETSDGDWGYKSLSEVVHPYHYSCPQRYLDKTPVQCSEWRQRVRAFHGAHASDPTPA